MKARFKLTHVEIRGYKSIAYDTPLTLELGNINILLGANGAGKSNIISFFQMLSYMMSGQLQQFVEQFGTNRNFLYYGPQKTPILSGTLQFENAASFDKYEFSLTNASPDRLIVSSEKIEWGKKSGVQIPFSQSLEPLFKESALTVATDQTSRTIHRILSSCKVYQFHNSSNDGPLRHASTVDSAHYLQAKGNNLASFLYYLKRYYPDSYRRIVEYVQMVVPQFRDFYLEPIREYVSLQWVDTSLNDFVFTADQLSDGSIRFIALATLLLQPERTMPNIIIIDEPELGLHPYAIDQLAEMIKDAALHTQIIVATQSPHLIDNFDIGNITVIEQNPEKRSTVARKLPEEEFKEWLEDYTVSELWDKDIIGGRPL